MRVRVKRYPSAASGRGPLPEAAGDDGTVAPGTLEEVDVPAGPFAAVGAIAGLIPTLITLLTFWMVDKPKADVARHVDANKAQLEILSKAMEVDDARGREMSFQLMTAMGLLQPGDRARVAALLAEDSLPRWGSAESDGGTSTDSTQSNGTGENPETAPARSP